jgi:Mrp family chromosome partitioning ATPase
MAKKARVEKNLIEAEPLELQGADGAPLITFPGVVIQDYRRMITRLINESQLPARVALIATLPEEGVTYTALALGTILANDWCKRVGVIELNWHRPGMLNFVPSSSSPGLAAVLENGASLDEVLIQTSLEGLALLPAGEMAFGRRTLRARGAELKTVIEQLAARFDHLILDIPAIRLTSDAIPLAALGNAACLVIRQGVTPSPEVKRALDDMQHLQMLGAVLNRVRVQTPRLILGWIPQE